MKRLMNILKYGFEKELVIYDDSKNKFNVMTFNFFDNTIQADSDTKIFKRHDFSSHGIALAYDIVLDLGYGRL